MKIPLTAHGKDGSGKQLDKIDAPNLVRFPTPCKPITPDDANAFIREVVFHRHVDHLHRLGPRAITELLQEIGAERSCMTSFEMKLERYAGLDRDVVAALGGDRCLGSPIHAVNGDDAPPSPEVA